MPHRKPLLAAGLFALLALAVLACFAPLPADRPAARTTTRKLLVPARQEEVPKTLQPFVARLLSPEQKPVEPAGLGPAGVFVRVVSRRYVLEGSKLKDDGWLGSAPFVFLTLPQALYGRSLLGVFSAIGYTAEEVLAGQLGEEKVAVVFAFAGVRLHDGPDGKLPAQWGRTIYPATWNNLFALAGKLASDSATYQVVAADRPAFTPTRLQLRSPREAGFLLGFPDAGKKRIVSRSYQALRAGGGADWAYRRILERSLGAAEHFRGDGFLQPTFVRPGKDARGFPEFLGPNRKVAALPDVAVIGLGALEVSERPPSKP